MPPAFIQAQSKLGDRIVQLGYMESFAAYARLLWRSDFVVSTARQEFFGVSVCEAMYCGCLPILPDRLNYPHLLPEAFKQACLYQRGRLTAQLRFHLDSDEKLDTTALQGEIARFDWRTLAPRYDSELEALAIRHRSRRDRSRWR